MTNVKKIIITGAIIATVGITSITAFAASAYKTPAEAAAGVTGKTVSEITQERQETGKTYGTIANEAGKLEEFKKEVLEMKKDTLNEQVAAGKITQERADEILKTIEENQATCDGTGSAKIGQKYGAGFGRGMGMKNGTRGGMRQGGGAGCGQGNCNNTGATE